MIGNDYTTRAAARTGAPLAENAVEVREVEKRFGSRTAVDGLSFEVRRGEVFALLGPNGAGKTTVVRMICGIIRPDSGSIRFGLGGETAEPSHLGYIPEDRGLYKDVAVLRTLAYFGALRGLGRREATRAAEEWLERFGLRDRARERLDALSKGNQQKVQLVAAVLHRPRVAIFDEPFSGLDPLNQELFLDAFRELQAGGTTILLSAHQMQLVERVADRILLLGRGREVLSGTLEEIRRRSGAGGKLVLSVSGEPELSAFDGNPAVESARRTAPGEVTLLLRPGARLSELLRDAGERLDVSGVRSEAPSLHDIYVRAVGAREGGER